MTTTETTYTLITLAADSVWRSGRGYHEDLWQRVPATGLVLSASVRKGYSDPLARYDLPKGIYELRSYGDITMFCVRQMPDGTLDRIFITDADVSDWQARDGLDPEIEAGMKPLRWLGI